MKFNKFSYNKFVILLIYKINVLIKLYSYIKFIKLVFFIFIFFILIVYYNIHFLNFLIFVEFIVITILFYLIDIEINSWLFLIFLVFSVCELVLGLSLLVRINYELGHQKLNILNLIY